MLTIHKYTKFLLYIKSLYTRQKIREALGHKRNIRESLYLRVYPVAENLSLR